MSARCATCNGPLPPPRAPGRPRKFCSERCRKLQYASDCLGGCGRKVNIDGRTTNPSLRCRECSKRHEHEQMRAWIIDSIREWQRRFGWPPSAREWNQQMACVEATGRLWPSPTTVAAHFGSWSAGITAAGLEPLPTGHHRTDTPLPLRALAVDLYRRGYAAETVAAAYGVSPSAVRDWLRAAGVPMRSPWETRRREAALEPLERAAS